MKQYYVYIMTNRSRTLYTGMTNDLQNRLGQHDWPELLLWEMFDTKEQASMREKEIKGWSIRKKQDLIPHP